MFSTVKKKSKPYCSSSPVLRTSFARVLARQRQPHSQSLTTAHATLQRPARRAVLENLYGSVGAEGFQGPGLQQLAPPEEPDSLTHSQPWKGCSALWELPALPHMWRDPRESWQLWWDGQVSDYRSHRRYLPGHIWAPLKWWWEENRRQSRLQFSLAGLYVKGTSPA